MRMSKKVDCLPILIWVCDRRMTCRREVRCQSAQHREIEAVNARRIRMTYVSLAIAPSLLMAQATPASSMATPTPTPSEAPKESEARPPADKTLPRRFKDMHAAATQTDECSKNQHDRKGAWACLAAGKSSDASLMASLSGWCDVNVKRKGCWEPVPGKGKAYGTTVNLVGSYGYGKTALGNIGIHAQTVMSGSRSDTKNFWFKSTRATKNVEFAVDRLGLTESHPGGVKTDASWDEVQSGIHPANVRVSPLRVPSRVDDSHQYITINHYVAWHDTSSQYPGHWFACIKSIRMKRSSSGAYWNEGRSLPADPANSGYSRAN